MQPRRSPKINFREIFWVVRFSTFATISAKSGFKLVHSCVWSPWFPAPVAAPRGVLLSYNNFVTPEKQALVDLRWILIFWVSQKPVEHEAKQVGGNQALLGVASVGRFRRLFGPLFPPSKRSESDVFEAMQLTGF